MMAAPFLFALSALPAGCHPIQSDIILARDVAAVIPGFTQLAADLRLGYLPVSGVPRILLGADLSRANLAGAKLGNIAWFDTICPNGRKTKSGC